MKICHLTVSHSRYDTRIFLKQCKTLASTGFHVTLLCADEKGKEVRDNVNILSYTQSDLSKLNRLRLLLFPSQLAKTAIDIDADIYQFHDLELFRVGLVLKKKGKKVIFDSHENWEGYLLGISSIPTYLRKLSSKLLTIFYRKKISKFDAVFSVSPNFVDNLKQHTEKVYLVPNYPILSNFEINNAIVNSNRFIYAGTVYKMSNQLTIAKALRVYPNAEYYVVGVIDEGLKLEMESLANENQITFINWVEKDELNDFYRSSIAGIVIFDYTPICANKEGQLGSNKIFEYMEKGLPVICTDFTLWNEMIIQKYNCGICVEPNNVDALTKAIKYIVENKEEARQMGINGRKAIENEFNWNIYQEEFVERYKLIYNE